jgi:hypothetical protein
LLDFAVLALGCLLTALDGGGDSAGVKSDLLGNFPLFVRLAAAGKREIKTGQ